MLGMPDRTDQMTHEVIWHGPVVDVHYLVEAHTEDEAVERLSIWLCDSGEDNAEGIQENR